MNKWKEENNQLVRNFSFENFKQAIEFVNKVAVLAEQANHHPDIFIHAYKQVQLTLSSHDAGGVITQKDVDLAQKIDLL